MPNDVLIVDDADPTKGSVSCLSGCLAFFDKIFSLLFGEIFGYV